MNFGPFDLSPLTNAVGDFTNQAAQGIQDKAEAAWQAAGQAAGAAADVVEDGLVLAGQTAQAAGNLAMGLAEGAAGVAGWVAQTTGTIAADQAQMGPELISLRQRAIDANQGEPVQRRHDTPQEAREFRDLSIAIYDSSQPLPEGYEEVPNAEEELGVPLKDPDTGLEAKVYRKDDTYVLVFEGSTGEDNAADWGVNFAQGGGAVPKQYRQALDIALRFKDVYGDRGDVVVTGHSLGGGLATFAGVGAGIETYTYNTSGLGPGTKAFLDSAGLVNQNQHLVKNYIQRGEMASIARVALHTVVNAALHNVPNMLGYGPMFMIGETERIGTYGRDPVSAHNDPDMSGVR